MVDGAPTGGTRVLVVDDSPEIRLVLDDALRDEGYEVRSAADGLEGLNAAAEFDPDVILLDLVMPVANAWQFCEAYRALPAPRAAIVVMSAVRDPEKAAADVGADAVLRKPFSIDGVLEAIGPTSGPTSGRHPQTTSGDAGARAGARRMAESPTDPAPPGAAGRRDGTPTRSGAPSRADGGAVRGARVLVVDDDAPVRSLLAGALAEEGYEVLEAADGDEALVALRSPDRERAVDVVLLDLMMPGTSGWAFLERYGADGGGAAVVVVTALDPSRVRLPSRVSAVVRKPFQVDRALRLVAQHTAGGAARRAGDVA